jgi:hypothetical protein
MIGLVVIDMIIVFIDLTVALLHAPCLNEGQIEWFTEHGLLARLFPTPRCIFPESYSFDLTEWTLWCLSIFLLCIFVLDLTASAIAFGFKYFKQIVFAVDAVVVFISLILEVVFKFSNRGKLETSPSVIIILRLWKIVRCVHAIAHSLELKHQRDLEKEKGAKVALEAGRKLVELELDRQRDLIHQQKMELDQHVVELDRQRLINAYLRRHAPHVTDNELERCIHETKMRRRTNHSDSGSDSDGSHYS